MIIWADSLAVWGRLHDCEVPALYEYAGYTLFAYNKLLPDVGAAATPKAVEDLAGFYHALAAPAFASMAVGERLRIIINCCNAQRYHSFAVRCSESSRLFCLRRKWVEEIRPLLEAADAVVTAMDRRWGPPATLGASEVFSAFAAAVAGVQNGGVVSRWAEPGEAEWAQGHVKALVRINSWCAAVLRQPPDIAALQRQISTVMDAIAADRGVRGAFAARNTGIDSVLNTLEVGA